MLRYLWGHVTRDKRKQVKTFRATIWFYWSWKKSIHTWIQLRTIVTLNPQNVTIIQLYHWTLKTLLFYNCTTEPSKRYYYTSVPLNPQNVTIIQLFHWTLKTLLFIQLFHWTLKTLLLYNCNTEPSKRYYYTIVPLNPQNVTII